MIILDTNVVSELTKPRPDDRVYEWLAGQPPESVFLTSVTEAELHYGVQLLPDGRRKQDLDGALRKMLEVEFRGWLLPFDSSAAATFGRLAAHRRSIGRPISIADAQIAAIARSRGADVATRNVDNFLDCGLDLIDPWRAEPLSRVIT